ncbi:MAG: DUF2231 domain-containing protein [Actinomycetota bacterium]|nr:DUF2231 domain-containing protein [Actinomycetota bacterium]
MKLDFLIRGTPGHPLHPPLTDATIGIYTFATIAALLDVLGIVDEHAARGWWLALVVGLVSTAPTALAGLVDWLTISSGTPLKRTATTHALTMVAATVFFLLAALIGREGYTQGDIGAGGFILTLIGFGLLTAGGTFGGSVTYVHGMRVLNLVEEPAHRALSPGAEPEKQAAERT